MNNLESQLELDSISNLIGKRLEAELLGVIVPSFNQLRASITDDRSEETIAGPMSAFRNPGDGNAGRKGVAQVGNPGFRVHI